MITKIAPITAEHEQQASFEMPGDFILGGIHLAEGDTVTAVGDGLGKYRICVNWGEGIIAVLNAKQVNEMAGFEVVSNELPCFCLERIGDNDQCKLHWGK